MNVLLSVVSFVEGLLSPMKQKAVASSVETDLSMFASKAGVLLSLITMAATFSGLSGDAQTTVMNYLTKAQQSLGALSSASSATDYQSLLNDFSGVVQGLPIGGADKAHLGLAISSLQSLLTASTTVAATAPAA